MLYDDIEDPEATSPEELREEYAADLAATIEANGVDAVVEETGVDRETVETLAEGDAAVVIPSNRLS